MSDNRREIYQHNLEMEMLTEGRLGRAEWARQAKDAAAAYARMAPKSDPYAYSEAMQRMVGKVFSIAEVRRAAKERWVL